MILINDNTYIMLREGGRKKQTRKYNVHRKKESADTIPIPTFCYEFTQLG